MDILRKELDAVYAAQELDRETLDPRVTAQAVERIRVLASVRRCCCVITDASADRCYMTGGDFCRLLGISDGDTMYREVDSSDEDVIYTRLHPEDLVEKRMLEYEYFRFVDPLPAADKVRFRASCTIRIKDRDGRYIAVDNTTQVLCPSPAGKIWLILCCYDLSSSPPSGGGIHPCIVNNATGEVLAVRTADRRSHILSGREKEVLGLIREGKPSKQIASLLGISVHTVNRHRQNIIEKLSVGNTVEAIMAATLMKLL